MNYKFQKKSIIVEAFQMTIERRWDNQDWPNWLNQAWDKESDEVGALFCKESPHNELYINTLEGTMNVGWEDWIIQGVKGEIYPCKPDIFEATYECVNVRTNTESIKLNV